MKLVASSTDLAIVRAALNFATIDAPFEEQGEVSSN